MPRNFFLTVMLSSLFLVSCGKKRPVERVLEDESRISKDYLEGEFYFLKSITDVQTPGFQIGQFLFPGVYLEQGNVVKFVFKEDRMDVVAVENPLYQVIPKEKTAVLASFPVNHVDVLWRQNSDKKDTRTEEVTTSRNTWEGRSYVNIDITSDSLDAISREYSRTITPTGAIKIDTKTGTINFELEKNLIDGTILTQKYSFMPAKKSTDYSPKSYSTNEKKTYGFFSTTTYSFNEYGRVFENDLNRYINRWHPDENIVYVLSDNYPEHLIEKTKEVFENWNNVFEEATGRRVLKLKSNTGEEMGDMRYNMVHYVDDMSVGSILGYGPSYSDPKTGQILKADVFLFASTLKRSTYSERKWLEELDDSAVKETGEFSVDLARDIEPGSAYDAIDFGLANMTREDVKGLQKSYKIQDEMMKILGEDYKDLDPQIKKLRVSDFKDYRKVTQLTVDMLNPIRSQRMAEDLTDEELEVRIFGPLLAHELGHNFGLRHNFMGSADGEFHDDSHTSSTVMDYTFLSSRDSDDPGAYDYAAMSFAYGGDDKKIESLSKNFFYCTDEDIFSSRQPLCAQFDSGTTLKEVVENQFKKYTASYKFSNLRGDRAFFRQNIGGYINSIFRFLLPFRLVIDNANAITEMVNTSYQQGTASEFIVFSNLWELLGKRIEADDATTAANTVELEISEGVTIKFDISKVQELGAEALDAKNYAVDALTATMLETVRPNYDSLDTFNRQLAIRGVLLDKLIAMIILAQDTPDPLGRGSVATALTDKEKEIGDLFVQMISNTRNTTDATRELFIWDVNLRRTALNLLVELTRPGKETSEMIEILTLLEFDDTDNTSLTSTLTTGEKADYDAIVPATTGHNDKIRIAIEGSLASSVTQTQLDAFNATVTAEMTSIAALDTAFINIKDRSFKTPITLDLGGLNLTSATGLMIRDSLNQFNIRVTAYSNAIATLDTQIDAETDAAVKLNLILRQDNYTETLKSFRRFVNQEKRLLEEIYSMYHPNR